MRKFPGIVPLPYFSLYAFSQQECDSLKQRLHSPARNTAKYDSLSQAAEITGERPDAFYSAAKNGTGTGISATAVLDNTTSGARVISNIPYKELSCTYDQSGNH